MLLFIGVEGNLKAVLSKVASTFDVPKANELSNNSVPWTSYTSLVSTTLTPSTLPMVIVVGNSETPSRLRISVSKSTSNPSRDSSEVTST